jgi:hypothetical protein
LSIDDAEMTGLSWNAAKGHPNPAQAGGQDSHQIDLQLRLLSFQQKQVVEEELS